jgi:hypothetical protein
MMTWHELYARSNGAPPVDDYIGQEYFDHRTPAPPLGIEMLHHYATKFNCDPFDVEVTFSLMGPQSFLVRIYIPQEAVDRVLFAEGAQRLAEDEAEVEVDDQVDVDDSPASPR